jgi:hypothetical protein
MRLRFVDSLRCPCSRRRVEFEATELFEALIVAPCEAGARERHVDRYRVAFDSDTPRRS